MKFYETIRFKFTWNIHNFVILLSILGTKRIEKGLLLFNKFLKFLLNKEESEVKEETVEAEVKSEEPEEIEVKEETVEAEVKSIKPKKRTVKDEIIDVEVDTDNK